MAFSLVIRDALIAITIGVVVTMIVSAELTRHGLAQLQCPEFVIALLLKLEPHSLVEWLTHFARHYTHL